ncbi:sulfite exporter TauE/SafE family protein [Reichenbachiella carrageenanivorans]|uniref:Probable membrane transporter protein n=1 Tax=Reichenbachiella carrageenanivorans TaxID=2979869 RepID=A0ABY6CWP4_9BACT|nr:sulfite exporter TauE/SafE family protein [Reichenbachiella carrageenanivorans]UXX78342.1 sulfite exporter TauE/SafE family protein [Reichenbachiella carrageenanivorans]
MAYYEYLLIFGSGLIAGFLNVVAGGGSLLTLPILIFLGLPPAVANGTNRVGIFLQNIFAVSGFKSKGVSSFRFSIWLSISALFGAIIGAKIAVDISGELFNRILAVVMMLVIVITVFNPNKSGKVQEELMSKGRQTASIIAFFFVGIYGGFIQAGVGFIIIATLTSINHLSLVKTNSIKVFVALFYTIFALAVFAWEGQVDWVLGLTLAAGTSIGGWVASRWSVNKGDKWIRYFLIVTVTLMAVKLWFF